MGNGAAQPLPTSSRALRVAKKLLHPSSATMFRTPPKIDRGRTTGAGAMFCDRFFLETSTTQQGPTHRALCIVNVFMPLEVQALCLPAGVRPLRATPPPPSAATLLNRNPGILSEAWRLQVGLRAVAIAPPPTTPSNRRGDPRAHASRACGACNPIEAALDTPASCSLAV